MDNDAKKLQNDISEDEARLNQFEQEKSLVENRIHIGFKDAVLARVLEDEIQTVERELTREKEKLAADRD